MSNTPLPSGAARLPFFTPKPITSAEYEFIRQTVYQHSRINLGPSKRELVMARLSKRLRALGLQSYAQYIELLQTSAGREEMTNLIDSISTNHTYFFREPQHFDYLANHILPEFCCDAPAALPKQFRIWSAATSTGEEPYTLSIVLDNHFQSVRGWNWRILCTDISTRVLKKAQAGVFSHDRIDKIRPDLINRYFERGTGESEGLFRVSNELRKHMQFVCLNLLAPSYPFNETFQVIFCRNVMIYFDRPTQQELVNKMTRLLEPGGYLIIGHAESLTSIHHDLKLIKPSIYRKPA